MKLAKNLSNFEWERGEAESNTDLRGLLVIKNTGGISKMTAFMNAIQTAVQTVAGYVYINGEAVVVGTKNVLVTAGDGIIAVGKALCLGVGIGG